MIKHVQDAHDIQLRADNDYVESDITDDEDDEKHKRNLIKIRRHESQQITRSPKIKCEHLYYKFIHPVNLCFDSKEIFSALVTVVD